MKASESKIPGLIYCALGAVLAVLVNHFFPTVSALLVAILLGIFAGNTIGVRVGWQPGVTFAGKKLLRLGIVLLGLQISLAEILQLGWQVAVIAVAAVVGGFLLALLLGRLLGLSSSQTLLIGAGFSICGAAAVAAVDGVLDDDRKEEETVTALALVVLCGTLMIFVLPAAAGLFGLSDIQTGIWAGAAVHEVAQVVAIGGALGAGALSAAVLVKLTRVLMLAPMMAAVSIWRRRTAHSSGGKLPPIIPLFVAAFLLLVAVRALDILPPIVLEFAAQAQTILLSIAMFALGLGVRASIFKRISAAPVIVAVAVTLFISVLTLAGVLWAVPA